MTIENITIGELKQISSLFNSTQTPSPESPHPFVGKYVICRCGGAGVHAGELVSARGDQVILKNSRRLWKWAAQGGIALSGLAMHGINAASSKLDTRLPEIQLNGVVEIIPCAGTTQGTIDNA